LRVKTNEVAEYNRWLPRLWTRWAQLQLKSVRRQGRTTEPKPATPAPTRPPTAPTVNQVAPHTAATPSQLRRSTHSTPTIQLGNPVSSGRLSATSPRRPARSHSNLAQIPAPRQPSATAQGLLQTLMDTGEIPLPEGLIDFVRRKYLKVVDTEMVCPAFQFQADASPMQM